MHRQHFSLRYSSCIRVTRICCFATERLLIFSHVIYNIYIYLYSVLFRVASRVGRREGGTGEGRVPFANRTCKGLRVLWEGSRYFRHKRFLLGEILYLLFLRDRVIPKIFFYTTLINGKSFVSFVSIN